MFLHFQLGLVHVAGQLHCRWVYIKVSLPVIAAGTEQKIQRVPTGF